MKKSGVLFFVLITFVLNAQDLHIYYDVHNDSMWYMRNNKVIVEPIVKKGKQVYFHLVEFNNYIYKAEFKATQSTAPFGMQSSGNSLVKGLLSGLVSGFVPGAGLALLNSPLFGNVLGAIPEGEDANAARGGNEELEAFQAKLKELEAAKEEINQITTDLNERRKSLNALQTTYEFTNALSRNKNVAPSMIKELLMKHCSEIFLKPANENIGLDEIATLNSKLVEIPLLEKKLKEKILNYNSGLTDLKQQRAKIQTIDHGIDELYPLIKKLELSEAQLEQNANQMAMDLDKQCAIDEAIKKTDYTSQIQQFYMKYHEIRENSFSYTHHSDVEQKYLIYEMDLYQIDSAMSETDAEKTSIKHIEIRVRSYGGAQFGMSVGLSGSSFDKAPQSFYVTDNTIVATNDDPFVPFITSMFNLSYDLGSYVTPAVSLGIGIPFSHESVESFGLFAGPGMYLGKRQAIMLSGGMMFSKVNFLKQPFEVGQNINIGDLALPTSKKFALGYFLSLTYNLSAM